MDLAFLRFFESLPAALAVGLLLLPRLIGEEESRLKPAIALFAGVRAVLGFFLVVAITRSIIPPPRPIDFDAVVGLISVTLVGKAWAATEILSIVFAGLAAARLLRRSPLLDRVTLWVGVGLLASTSLTGHAIDDTLPLYTQISFLLHTAAGLTWFGGLFALIWWMYAARGKSPEVARQLAERWSVVAKIAMAIVFVSGVILAWETVGSFANLFATPYGRLLTIKLACLCAILLIALALARYITREPAGTFDTQWYSRTGAVEGGFGVVLLFIAGWIAVINPAAHETDLYWPLPFRLSWAATWGYWGLKVPLGSAPMWWGGIGVALLIAGGVFWFLPQLRRWREVASPAVILAGTVSVAVSFSTQAYPDTFNDPTVDYTAESIYRGQQAFQANCVGCHGATGEGNGPLAKDLKDAKGVSVQPADLTAPHVSTHTIGDIFHWLTSGGQSGVMPGFSDVLGVDDRWDMINYLLVLSYTQQVRFLGPGGQIQWMIAPDFALKDPADQITTLSALRGTPTLISFARCTAQGEEAKAVAESVQRANEAAKASGANHVTVYQGDCPKDENGRAPVHPEAVESVFSVLNRYPNETYSQEITQAHFLIDRSGYLRARFREFGAGDGSAAKLQEQVALMAKEPVVTISLHSH